MCELCKKLKPLSKEQRDALLTKIENLSVVIAEDIFKGNPVFTSSWLERNNVEAFEFEFLKAMVADSIRGFIKAPPPVREQVMICSKSKDKDDATKNLMVAALEHVVDMLKQPPESEEEGECNPFSSN